MSNNPTNLNQDIQKSSPGTEISPKKLASPPLLVTLDKDNIPVLTPSQPSLSQSSTLNNASSNITTNATSYLTPLAPTTPTSPISSLHGDLGDRQQERLIGFINDQLRQIRRRFAERQLNLSRGYTNLQELLVDLNKVVDILWYSFTSSQPSIILAPLSIPNHDAGNLGDQTRCLLKIADNLVDYLDGFAPNYSDPDAVIRMFHKLDKILMRLLDEKQLDLLSNSSDYKWLRLIIDRSRLAVMKMRLTVKDFKINVSTIYSLVSSRIS